VGIDRTNVENNCASGGCAVSVSIPSSPWWQVKV
jgi:hypothetical protein